MKTKDLPSAIPPRFNPTSFWIARQVEVSQSSLMGTVSIHQPPVCAVVPVVLAAHPNNVPPIRRETGMLIVAFSMRQASDLAAVYADSFPSQSIFNALLARHQH